MNKQFKLFFYGFAQVFLISMNTVFLSKSIDGAVLILGYLISMLWTINVNRIVATNWVDRNIYSIGAAIGTWLGLIIAELLKKYLI